MGVRARPLTERETEAHACGFGGVKGRARFQLAYFAMNHLVSSVWDGWYSVYDICLSRLCEK
jgi:hypothetical protein